MTDPIERFVSALRAPGRAVELEGEADAVDALASVISTHEGAAMQPTDDIRAIRGRRPWRVATAIAAGVVAFGGVAAAGPGAFPAPLDPAEVTSSFDEERDQPASTVAPATTEPATSEPETTGPETTEPETNQPETTELDPLALASVGNDEDPVESGDDEIECAEGNHGKTVSSVARSEDRTSSDVVKAAQSSCGKDDDDSDGDGDPQVASDDDDSDDDDDDRDDDDDDDDDRNDDGDDDDRDDEADSGASKDRPGKSGEAPGRSGENKGSRGSRGGSD